MLLCRLCLFVCLFFLPDSQLGATLEQHWNVLFRKGDRRVCVCVRWCVIIGCETVLMGEGRRNSIPVVWLDLWRRGDRPNTANNFASVVRSDFRVRARLKYLQLRIIPPQFPNRPTLYNFNRPTRLSSMPPSTKYTRCESRHLSIVRACMWRRWRA